MRNPPYDSDRGSVSHTIGIQCRNFWERDFDVKYFISRSYQRKVLEEVWRESEKNTGFCPANVWLNKCEADLKFLSVLQNRIGKPSWLPPAKNPRNTPRMPQAQKRSNLIEPIELRHRIAPNNFGIGSESYATSPCQYSGVILRAVEKEGSEEA